MLRVTLQSPKASIGTLDQGPTFPWRNEQPGSAIAGLSARVRTYGSKPRIAVMKQIYSPRTQIRWKHPWRKHTAETGSQTTPLARNKAHRLAPGFSTAMQRRQLLSHTSVNQQQRAKRSQRAGVFTAKWLAPWVEKLLCAADRTGTPNALRLAWRHGGDLGLVCFHQIEDD